MSAPGRHSFVVLYRVFICNLGRGGAHSGAFAFPAVARQGRAGRHVSSAGVQTQGEVVGCWCQRPAVGPLQRRRRSHGYIHGAGHASGRGKAMPRGGRLRSRDTSPPTTHDARTDQGMPRQSQKVVNNRLAAF